jgi:peroxiredoxin
MNLQEQLNTYKKESQAKASKEKLASMMEYTKILSESGLIDKAPGVGDKLKGFTLSNHLGEKKTLPDFYKKGPVVIIFYRGGWCPYCNLQLRAYQEVLPQIKAAGASLIAITPELPDASLTTSEKHNLEFDVLSDPGSEYARELGIVFTLAENIQKIYLENGLDVEKHNGSGQFDLPFTATFIIDGQGTITYAFVDTDYTKRAEPADVIKELESLVAL